MRAPDRQRFLDAVAFIERPDVPLFEMEADMGVVNAMLGTSHPLSMRSYDLPPDELVAWNRRMGNDMVYLSHIWRVGRKERTDESGRIHYIDGTIKSEADLDELWFPDLDEKRARLEAVLEALEGTGMGLVVGAQGAPFTSTAAIGYADFCLAVLECPDFVEEVQVRLHDYAMRELEMILAFSAVDGVRVGFGGGLQTNHGPMLSPELMETFCYRWMEEMMQRIRAAGKIVTIHMDGVIEPAMPRLLECGGQVLNPIDPAGGAQDIYAIKARWGDRICLHGNIDIDGVLRTAAPEAVREDVREHIRRLGRGGGYVVASSHDLHHLLPLANIEAMRDAVHETRLEPAAPGAP
jgi:uroporphyrinogen decarboxylase